MSLDYSHYRCTPKMACFNCRKCFKHQTYASQRTTCPDCGGELHNMGTHFRPPRRDAVDHWKAIEMLYEAGVRFEVFDSHYHGWTESYKKQASKQDDILPFELHQILYENNVREYGQENWKPFDDQWPGPRPTHPRDVPAFLKWWKQQEAMRRSIVLKVCYKLGIDPPKGLRGELLLQNLDNPLHPKSPKQKAAAPLKKRKRNKRRDFDNT